MNSLPLQEECLCIIFLNINAEGIRLTDQFEWDISEENNNPLEFAQLMVSELGLPQIFENLICHEIYRQIYLIKKHIFLQENAMVTNFRESKKRGRKKDEVQIEKKIKTEKVTPLNLFRPLESADDWSPKIEFLSGLD